MPVVIDFETKAIDNGSGLAPAPVGVAIQRMGQAPRYYSFGHFSGGNNCTEAEARQALLDVWDEELVFHNAKFDISVAMEHWDLPFPKNFHDTQFLLYLHNPIAKTLSLKPSAEALLGMPPEEQDAVKEWLIANQRKEWLVQDHKSINNTNFGAYIWRAPATVVGPYACGDVDRTGKLFEHLMPLVQQRQMGNAYQREINLVQIGYDLESQGVRVDREALIRDREKYKAIFDAQGDIIRSYLGDIDLSKPAEIAKALEASPYASALRKTPTGKLSTAADALAEAITEFPLLRALRYRATLHTLLNTFFANWLKFSARDGCIHPSWNQTRGQNGYGTRTGRFSCSAPNLTNVPTEFWELDLEKTLEEQMAANPLFGLDIPFMRRYILPDPGHVIVAADYNGQEMRGLAHFAEGKALEIYNEDPTADFHKVAVKLVRETSGLELKRKQAKITGFSLIYGAGVNALAAQLGVSQSEAYQIKTAYLKAIPGLKEFQETFYHRREIKTWGGRIIPAEPGWEYKLCNYLIQGSAADQTKESLIRYDNTRVDGFLLGSVHDEVVTSIPEECLHTEIPILREAMENQPGWDVPFVVDIEYGKNWKDMVKYERA